METYNVLFLQEALDDLEEIVIYISHNNQAAAVKMYNEIIQKVNDLSFFPKRYRLVPENKMSKAGYRALPIKSYIVFYRIIDSTVFIYRVVHGATNYSLLYERLQHGAD
jgi:addiction module RelE/StbE family toxin